MTSVLFAARDFIRVDMVIKSVVGGLAWAKIRCGAIANRV